MTDKATIDFDKIEQAFTSFRDNKPFPFAVIDGFFDDKLAKKLEAEFPDFDSPIWHEYNNPLEIKKTCNNWNQFPPLTYSVFDYLNSIEFCHKLTELSKIAPLYSDAGLNGGGWHIHKQGGRLNPHLDYSMHPKLPLQRKLNLLIYLNSDWQDDWGGHLGLWNAKNNGKAPKDIAEQFAPKFNRAIIFDTTQNSWHGLIDTITSPENQHRKSIATYYLTTPAKNADSRGKALFAPTEDQKGDEEIKNLIKQRASVSGSKKVYKS